MSELISNSFSITINKPVLETTPLTTQVLIYKGTTQLSPVNTTPSIGQYKVTITGTTNCVAQLQSDNKTIKLLSIISNNGEIEVSINVENINTYTKIIPVASITDTEIVQEMYTKAEQTSTKFSWIVKSGTSSSNMELTDDMLKVVARDIDLTGKVTFNSFDSSTKTTINNAINTANSASSTANSAMSTANTVSNRISVDASNWDSAYNRVVQWAYGSPTTTTTIDGGNIQTGTITADKIAANAITANAIASNAISGKNISGGTITGAYIESTSGSYYTIMNNGYIYTNQHIVLKANSPGLKGEYSDGSWATICHVSRNNEMIFGYGSYDSSQSYTAYSNGTEYRGGAKTILKSKGSVWLGCNDGVVNSTGGQSIIYVYNSAGRYTFRSNGNGNTDLGYSNMPWRACYANTHSNTSDRTLKENIQYISSPTNPSVCSLTDDTITLDDCYDFIKNRLPIATYNYIADEEKLQKIGFIAQDILCDEYGNDDKIGQMILGRLSDSEEGEKLCYDINNVLGVILSAMQVMAKKIEDLENK